VCRKPRVANTDTQSRLARRNEARPAGRTSTGPGARHIDATAAQFDAAGRARVHLVEHLTSGPEISRRVLRLAGAALTAELAIFASTFLHGPALVPQVVVFVLAIGLFPLHLRTALAMARLRLDERELLRYVHKPAIAGTILVMLGVIVVSLWAPGHLPGQPVHHNGRYYFNDHGFQIQTDKPGYDRGVKLEERGFSGIPAMFFAIGVAVNLALLKRRRFDAEAP
jgi:hypothetical protein